MFFKLSIVVKFYQFFVDPSLIRMIFFKVSCKQIVREEVAALIQLSLRPLVLGRRVTYQVLDCQMESLASGNFRSMSP